MVVVVAILPIDHDAIEYALFQVFFLDVDITIRYSVVEHTLWNLQLRTLLLHGQQ